MATRQELEQAISTLETERGVLGAAVVDPALAGLRQQLASLTNTSPHPEEATQQRRVVTIIFVDIVGSTRMGEQLDPEDMLDIIDTALQRFARLVEAHHGRVDRYLGDGLMAIFGFPVGQEDDAEQAVRTGLAITTEAKRYAAELANRWPDFQVRVGIHTGLVALGGATEANYTAIGTTVNLAARMEAAAPANGVLISQETYQHVGGLVHTQAQQPIQVKGRSDPLHTYIVTGLRPRAFLGHTRGVEGIETRLIGRMAELTTLQAHWRQTCENGRFHALTVLGDAGVGKSRLLEEFGHWHEATTSSFPIFKGRATLETQSLPFGLIRDFFALSFDIQESDSGKVARQKLVTGLKARLSAENGERSAHFIGQLIGFDFRRSPHLTAVTHDDQIDARQLRDRALTYLHDFFTASGNPVLLLLEDIHWADSSSLDLLDDLSRLLAHTPLLMISLARPALLEKRPLWGEHFPYHIQLPLAPLSPEDSHHLVTEILQKVQQVPDDLRQLVVTKAEGNPFYLEEIIKMLIEDGAIVKGTPFWRVEPDRFDPNRIPTTLTGVLQASLDRLSEDERVVLQQASVVGRTFWDAVVARINQAVNETITEDEVQKVLSALRGKEMIYRRPTSSFARAQELIFKHAILREVTYESVLKRVRRTYHSLVADWLIENSNERSGEYTGLIADHLEKAGDRARAVTYLQQAGQQAAEQYANSEAIAYFSRALQIAAGSKQRYALLLAREKVYDFLGQRDEQAGDLVQLEQLADELGEAFQGQIALRRANYAGYHHDYATTIDAAQLAIASAQASDDIGLQAAGYLQWGWALRRQGHIEEAQLQMTQALELAHGAGLRAIEADSLRSLGVAFAKAGDNEHALDYYQRALALYRQIGDRRGEGRSLSGLGNLANQQQDYLAAADYYEHNLAICREIGDRYGEGWALWWLGTLCNQHQDLDGAKHYYKMALRVRRAINDQRAVALTLTHLGRTAQYQHDYATAITHCEDSLRLYRSLNDKDGMAWAHWWLAGIAYELADYQAAQTHYEQVHILRPTSEVLTLSRLGQLALQQQQYAIAGDYFTKSLQLSRKNDDTFSEGYALNHLGNLHADLGNFKEARQFYTQSLSLRQGLGTSHLALEPLAGLARVCLAAGDNAQARAHVDEALAYLQNRSLQGVADIFRVYLICLQVLQQGDNGRFHQLLQEAHTLLQEQARYIPDRSGQIAFWEVPTHQAIRSLQAKG